MRDGAVELLLFFFVYLFVCMTNRKETELGKKPVYFY